MSSENIIKLNDGNCEDINYFKDAAEAGSRSVVNNPYTNQELSDEEISLHEEMNEKYQSDRANNYLRLPFSLISLPHCPPNCNEHSYH